MTDRLLRALECPHLRVLGHPTGRILMHRDPFPFDFERVVAEAVKRGVWLEINASPERLDLNSTHGEGGQSARARSSRSPPTRIIPKHLDNMRYGVITARRGKPTAAFDDKWGRFVIDSKFFTKLVYDGL